ncbi:S-layer homology domain-containing protein [Paenibacillus agaridevorans]|nr:S-layer homology domain-containing protein [Paenibacillus agaridevorans]
MRHRFVKVIMAFMLFSSLTTIYAHAEPVNFKDTGKHWAKAQIDEAVQKGYVNGFPDGSFKPDQPVTRAQFVKMIVTALGLDFAPEGSVWYETYVESAKNAGIYQSQDFDAKKMNENIVRQHMAWLAVRAADDTLHTVESSGITKEAEINRWPLTATNNKITRSDAFMRKYYEGFLVHQAFGRGILNGFGGNVIDLDRTTTRAQAVTVIERILSLREGKKLVSDKYATAEAELLWLKTNAFTMAPHIFDDPKGVSMRIGYKLENLVFQNATLHSEVKRIILIDLDDAKDPYRKLLPETNLLGFRDGNFGKMPSDAYAMYIEYETFTNKNPKQYVGEVTLRTQSYKQPSPFPFDKLVQPSVLITKEKGFEHVSSFGPSKGANGVGSGVMVWAIPNSGYSLNENIGSDKNKPDRIISFTFYTSGYYGDPVTNTIFYGTTTHYSK